MELPWTTGSLRVKEEKRRLLQKIPGSRRTMKTIRLSGGKLGHTRRALNVQLLVEADK